MILYHIWDRLKLNTDEWRKIYKALFLLEIILKVGDPKCVKAVSHNIYKVRSWQSIKFEAHPEKGRGIKEKSKAICELVDNKELLEEERMKMKDIRSKFLGMSTSGSNMILNYRWEIWRN